MADITVMRYLYITILSLIVLISTSTHSHAALGMDTPAKQAIVIDYDTGLVLLEKNADEHMPTSSMSKVMTTILTFDALKQDHVKLDTTFLVSEKAWRKGGSKMFVEVDKSVKVEDLLRGVIIQSGNDATIVLAEGLAGTEEAFADAINRKAHELGMKNSHFMNASGWPDPNHYSTARDLSKMAVSLIRDYSEFYPIFSETEFTFNEITQPNRNPLLYRDVGADGIKTGHTEDGGYGLIGSGSRDGRRAIIVVNGLSSSKERATESAKLLAWALQSFENKAVISANQPLGDAPVIYGKSKTVGASVSEDLVLTLPKLGGDNWTKTVKLKDSLTAPIKKGQEVGSIVIDVPNLYSIERPLIASNDVEELGFFWKMIENARIMIMGK